MDFPRLLRKLFGITQPDKPDLTIIQGSKVKLKEFDSKSTVYNPREFRTDKGPRK